MPSLFVTRCNQPSHGVQPWVVLMGVFRLCVFCSFSCALLCDFTFLSWFLVSLLRCLWKRCEVGADGASQAMRPLVCPLPTIDATPCRLSTKWGPKPTLPWNMPLPHKKHKPPSQEMCHPYPLKCTTPHEMCRHPPHEKHYPYEMCQSPHEKQPPPPKKIPYEMCHCHEVLPPPMKSTTTLMKSTPPHEICQPSP